MKIVLASYSQVENHGPGRKIGISPSKPKDVNYDCLLFEQLSPGDIYWDYHKRKKAAADLDGDERSSAMEEAGAMFREAYLAKLESLKEDILKSAKEDNLSPIEVLPFQEGDTLLSWEHKGHTSYRTAVADFLRELGYDVEEN